MSSRENILAAIKSNQPEKQPLPNLSLFEYKAKGSLEKFSSVLKGIGGKISYVSGYDEINQIINSVYGTNVKIVSNLKELKRPTTENLDEFDLIHELQNIQLAVLRAQFGVAENGAVWITENEMQYRVLPFITEHLAVVIDANSILPNMHHAYDKISASTYGFGTFIAGPSKTADIEQSLVIGAHGARSMTVFVMMNNTQKIKQI